MDLHIVRNEHETSWQCEDRERATFRRMTESQGAAQALHFALAELVTLEPLTADALQRILRRLESMGYTVKRQDHI